MNITDKSKVITGVARSSYMYVLALEYPRKKDGKEDLTKPKEIRSQILIPKKDKKTIDAIKKAIKFAAVKKFGRDVKINSKNFGYPLRDGDEELKSGDKEGDHYKGHYFLNSKNYRCPQVAVNDDGEITQIIEPDELADIVSSGFYYRFSIKFRGYSNESDGVRVELNNILFVKKGDRLDGGVDAETDFKEISDDDDGDDDYGDESELIKEVEEAYSDFVEENTRKEGKAILNNYDIKKINEIESLEVDELNDLLEELTE